MAEPSGTTYSGNITDFGDARGRLRPDTPLSTGGGGGTFDPMEARVTALEGAIPSLKADIAEVKRDTAAVRELLLKIDAKLDAKAGGEALAKIGGDLGMKMVAVEKDLISKASAVEVSSLKGAVDKLPTTIQLAGFILAVFVAAGVAKHFGW